MNIAKLCSDMSFKKIESIKACDLPLHMFENEFLNQRPVVIKDYVSQWPAFQKWSPEFFYKEYKNSVIQVRYFEKNSNVYSGYIDITMDQYIKYYSEYDLYDEHLYLSGWEVSENNISLCKDVEVPIYFKEDYFNHIVPEFLNFYRMWIFIGHPKVQLKLHKDKLESCSWLAMIKGHKHVRVYKNPIISDRCRTLFPVHHSDHEILDDDIFDMILSPGDLLYVPANWYHELKNIDKNIMLTGNFLSKPNVDGFLNHAASIYGDNSSQYQTICQKLNQ